MQNGRLYRAGFVQVVSDKDTPQAATDVLAAMRAEWVVCVEGRVKTRTAPNDKIPTGLVEIAADKARVVVHVRAFDRSRRMYTQPPP